MKNSPNLVKSLVCEQEVVCTNIDNNLFLGSGPGASLYRPAAELSGAQFEIASGAQFEIAVVPNHVLYKQTDRIKFN
ncbi:hypothetical protein E2C01_091623 [Portunus trituberculatus]|uniref:Uncharacterized protein n=1 Tax=Portunus trituberculatus TaxID=210409 RepID=A0A5B7JPV8_PORTR|nr:hypothetical protein [Portunus trituberculatus]